MIHSLYLKITNRCNMKCRHCFIGDFCGDMDLPVLQRVTHLYPTARIVFHGGEPTLMGVTYVKQAISILGDRHYIMQSNLLETDSEWIPLIKKHFGGKIGTSFDTSRLPHLTAILNNISLFSHHEIDVTAVVTITEDLTTAIMSSFLRKFQYAGGRGFRLQFVSPVKTNPVNPRHYVDFVKTFYNHPLNENRKRLSDALCMNSHSGINGGNCARGLRTVDPDGTVYVCPDFAGQRLFPLGSVHDDSPLSLNGPHRAFFEREETLSLTCCDEWHICRGGCFASAYYNTGNPLTKDPYCEAYKEIFSFARSREGHSAA